MSESPTPLWSRFCLPLYLVLVGLAAAFLFISHDNYPYAAISGSDGQAYYAHLRSAWIDGDLDYRNEFGPLNRTGHGRETLLALLESPHTGLLFNRYPVGYALSALPFFALAHGLALAGPWEADGYSLPYQWAVIVGALAWAGLAFWTTSLLLRRFFSPGAAALAPLALFLAFPGTFSVIQFWCNPYMQSLVATNLLFLVAWRRRDRYGTRYWAALGALVGAAMLLRTELAVLGLLPLLLFLRRAWRRSRDNEELVREIRRALAAPLAAALVFLPQIILWRLLWGRWFHLEMNNPGEGFNWLQPVLFRVLFSTRHGLFYWSPMMLAGLLGLLAFWREGRGRPVTALVLVQLLAYWYLFACWKIWWMGYSFGARQFIPLAGLFALGLAWFWERLPRWRPLQLALAGLLILWNAAMLWMFLNAHIPRSEGFHPLLPFRKFAQLLLEKLGG